GITLEVDAEAYEFLCACRSPGPLPPANHPAAHLVPQLIHLGFLVPAPSETTGALTPPPQATSWLGDGYTLSAPETIHLAITARCNYACPGCYVPHPGAEPELSPAEWCRLIDQWAQMRVFQLAVGGGEPLLYPGLFEVLAHARARGIVPSLTTNGTRLTAETVRRLAAAGVARVNLSWDADEQRQSTIVAVLQLLLDSTLQTGVNLLVTPTLLSDLPRILAQLRTLGVQRATILRPKPGAANAAWYETSRLHRADLLRLRAVLREWQGVLDLEVDSALVSLMRDQQPAFLRRRAVYGCAAARRICTVWPDGLVTPCSFLADLGAGNVRQVPFTELWRRGENWEPLRDANAQPQDPCAGCDIIRLCGGARCIARYEKGDLLAGDAACPQHHE
ncbi:MAG: radical SAM protein, partial [Chloroflexi bacterium]|nr:radical SAM protein [Chloroflexota bacterium]